MWEGLPVERVIEGLGESGPDLSLLVGHNDPDNGFDQGYPDDVERDSCYKTVFDTIDRVYEAQVVVFPLDVDKTCENAHEVSRGSHVGFIIEVVHEVRLRS